VTSPEVTILGIFEDRAQEDFHRGLLTRAASNLGIGVWLTTRLTKGCRFDYLREHLEDGYGFSGVVVGVDGKKRRLAEKVRALEDGVRGIGLTDLPHPLLWSVASPSIEGWMMADAEALPAVLHEALGTSARSASRPGRASSEATAKQRLRDWTLSLAGRPLLRGGLEYAEEVALRVDVSRVGARRNPDLRHLLETKLPQFLAECTRGNSPPRRVS